MTTKMVLVLGILLGLGGFAVADDTPPPQRMNTTQLISTLSDAKDDQHYEAMYWIYGFAYGLRLGSSIDGNPIVCGDAWTPKQITAVFLKYANEHPERWGQISLNVVTEALVNAFPCKAETSK